MIGIAVTNRELCVDGGGDLIGERRAKGTKFDKSKKAIIQKNGFYSGGGSTDDEKLKASNNSKPMISEKKMKKEGEKVKVATCD